MVKFGSARIGENGKARGGRRGDSTGYECCEQVAYWHKNGWIGLRAKDPNVANAIAWWMKVACRSNLVGYNQDERYLIFFTELREGVLTNADCSTLAPFCARQAGAPINVDGIWTGNMVERYLETGMFDKFNVTSLDELYVGDTLIDGNLTAHTVVVTDGLSRLDGNTFDVPEPVLQVGSKGDEVRKLQAFFNEYGNGCKVDGDFGRETWLNVCTFQKLFGLEISGIYEQKTRDLVMFYLSERGVIGV